MIDVTNEDRKKCLESLGFDVEKHSTERARSRRWTLRCKDCSAQLIVIGNYGEIGWRVRRDSSQKALPLLVDAAGLHNLERDAVFFEARDHSIRCKATSHLRAAARAHPASLTITDPNADPVELAEFDAQREEMDEVRKCVEAVHGLYEHMKTLSQQQSLTVAGELAYFLRGLGFSEAADALEYPSWRTKT